MPTIIDSLLVRLGWKVDPKGLEGFAAATGKAKGLMLGLGAAVAGAFYGVEHLVHGAVERMGGIQNFAEQMGMSARSVDALGKVAKANDSSLEAMESGLRALTITAGQAAQGVGRGALLFKKYGLSAKDATKPTEELLGIIADKMQKLPSNAQQKAFGSRLGFDDATIFMLAKGRANLEQLRAEALKGIPFADSQYEMADKTDKLFKKASGSVMQLKDRLAVGLLPTVNSVLDRFIAWTKNEQNVRKLQDAINKVVDALALVAKNMDKIAAAFAIFYTYKMGAYFLGLAAAITTAAKGQALLTLGVGAMKTLLTGGLLGLILLLAEDLWTYYRGGRSVTGWMMKQFPYAVQVMEGALVVLGAAFLALTFSSGPVGLFALAIGAIIIGAKELHDNWDPVLDWYGEKIDWLTDKIFDMINLFTKTTPLYWALKLFDVDMELPTGEAARPKPGRSVSLLNKGLGALDPNKLGNMLTWGRGGPAAMPFATPPAQAGGQRTTIGSLNLNIQGGNLQDPEAAERLIDDMAKQLKQRGISPGRSPARGYTSNEQSNVDG